MEHIIDAKNQTLGRLSSKIAGILQGKHEVGYDPKNPSDNKVIVKNVGQMKVTGRKAKGSGKIYYRHTGYMGHLRETTYEQAFEKSPEWVLRHSVLGMLPKNRIRKNRIKNLIIEK